MIGKVKWFNKKKGFGFLVNEEGVEYFVHYSDIESDKKYKVIDNEQQVSFEVFTDDNGKSKAIHVKAM